MSFADDYLKYSKPSQDRENFVYNTITSLPKNQLLDSMKPITVNGPNNTKITYKVMPDYIMGPDGKTRLPMSGQTAQKVADYFGLSLPTANMAKDIYQNADVKVTAQPLSGSGTVVDGQHYSGTDVVNTGVGYAPFAINYNNKVNQQLSDKGAKSGQIVSGFAKDIVAPPVSGDKLGLYGLYDANGNPIQGGIGQTPHDTSVHTEYGSFARLVSDNATVTYPDGHTEVKPIDQVYQINKYSPSNKYLPSKNQPIIEQTSKPIQSPVENKNIVPNQSSSEVNQPSGRLSFLQRIDQFLSGLEL